MRIDVKEDRPRPRSHDGTGGGKEAERRGDDRIAGLHADRGQRKPEGVGAGRASDGVFRAGERCKFALE